MSPAGPDDVASARRVLALEADALLQMGRGLDQRFVAVVDLLGRATGRVIVTGMGKSGLVGRKIAATLASTGTPAYYVHPAEASHGDLGMIAPGDAVLALSNSGNTRELADIVEYTRRFSIPLVAITGRAGSMLAETADAALVLPEVPEACPMGLAPTTSTTMTLALGDAIAVALLERRGFAAADFHILHPGGQLGRHLQRVGDLMHAGAAMPLATPDTPMSEAVLTMTSKHFGCLGVTDEAGRLIGIVTDGDLRRHMGSDLLAMTAGMVMTGRPKTIRPQALAAEAVAFMNKIAITSLFVVEKEVPVGILHIHDCLRAGVG